jgi:hypothetical protein
MFSLFFGFLLLLLDRLGREQKTKVMSFGKTNAIRWSSGAGTFSPTSPTG